MTYETPEIRRPGVRAALDALLAARRVVLTTHVNADGDGTGCQAALLALLLDAGAEAWIVNPTPFPDTFRFLVPDPGRILDAKSDEAARRCREADLCVVVDTAEKSRIGRVNPLVDHLPKVVIDHHPADEEGIEGTLLQDTGASAAGELVYDLVLANGGPWTESVIDGLYVAILTDTGSFRFSNATPTAHRVVADLIARGASPDELHRRVYERTSTRRMRLLARALETLEVSPDGEVGWMVVPRDTYEALGCTSEDLDGMVDYPRSIDGVEVALLFRELEEGTVKLSLRSNGRVDVNALARELGGGGHVRAAGARVEGDVETVIRRVVDRAVELAGVADEAGEVEPAGEEGVDP